MLEAITAAAPNAEVGLFTLSASCYHPTDDGYRDGYLPTLEAITG